MAFTFRWNAVNSVAIAIDWSTRVNVRSRRSRSSSTASDFSASTQICAIVSTVSTGYFPAAVSADSMTASVPSRTALATSETSARVGTGARIIDSIICVAVIVSLLRSRASLIIRFCRPGTAAVAHFDREVAARDHDAVRRIDDLVEVRDRLRALDLRDQQRIAARGAQQLARHVHVFLVLRERDGEVVGGKLGRRLDVLHVLRGQRGRGQSAAHPVDALVVGQRAAHHDARDDPRAVDGLDVEPDQAVVEQQHRAARDVARQLLVVEAGARRVAEFAFGVEDERLPGLQRDLAVDELADADLRALQVGHDRDFDGPACARIRARGARARRGPSRGRARN